MSTPSPGWYPDPQDPSRSVRWWNGQGWTAHIQPTPLPQPIPLPQPNPLPYPTVPAAVPGWSTAGAGPGASPTVTASGMRPLSGFFSDIGRIVTRAWAPILAISLAVGVFLTAVLALLTASVVDFDSLWRLFDALGPLEPMTAAQEDRLASLAAQAFPAGWVAYTVVGVIAVLVAIAGTAFQAAAINRIGVDAAAGQPVTWSAGWRAGLRGGPRLFLALLSLLLLSVLAVSAAVGVVVLLALAVPPLAFVAGTGFVLGSVVLGLWLSARLAPLTAAAAMGRRPLRWSWTRTGGRAMAVLGRWLLWTLIVSAVVQVVSSVVLAPVGLVGDAAANGGDFGDLLRLLTVSWLIAAPVTIALNGLSVLGAVPIWRDLTDEEPYAALPTGTAERQP